MMCEECEEFPAQYVAHFNKQGGKFWRPAQKVAKPWAIDIRPAEQALPIVPVRREFICDDPMAARPVPVSGHVSDEKIA